jgi:hypothetical protein
VSTKRKKPLRLPVLSLGAEYLVQGYLMRRNILTYKSPPGNEGHDLLCIHPDPRKVTRQIRVQVKSRYATDSNKGFPLKSKSLDAFDYLILVCQNIGYFYRSKPVRDGLAPPTFYTLPAATVCDRHVRIDKGWEIFHARGDLAQYQDAAGFELIARDLDIPYPSRGEVKAAE